MANSRIFGTREDGWVVTAHELKSELGFRAVILNHGATLQAFYLPNGRNVVLGYDDWSSYETDANCTGSIIGRNANRIANASFKNGNQTYGLLANDGPHNLHSGPDGFDTQIWDVEEIDNGLELRHSSPDGQNGFPGEVDVRLIILLRENILRLEMEGVTSKPTPLNLTWHPYWNLSIRQRIDGHDLQVQADARTELQTRDPIRVKDTRQDFRLGYPLGSIQLDENYANVANTELVTDGNKLRVTSSLPDMQIYTGDGLPSPRAGIALEPQFRPNDINLEQNCLLKPGRVYRHWIEYAFDVPKA